MKQHGFWGTADVHVDMVTATMASSLYKLLWDSIDGIHEQQGYT